MKNIKAMNVTREVNKTAPMGSLLPTDNNQYSMGILTIKD
jgi:hypothetical protein